MNTEREYRYNGPESEGRFKAKLADVMGLFYSDRFPPPKQLGAEAWEIIGKNRTERQVLLALDYLKAEYRKDRVVSSLRDAREYAHTVEAKAQAATRNETLGGADALLADNQAATPRSRAYLACTRWCAREVAELARQGKDIGHPERQAIHEYHARQFDAIDRNDPETVGRWIEWAEAERQVHQARKGVRRAG